VLPAPSGGGIPSEPTATAAVVVGREGPRGEGGQHSTNDAQSAPIAHGPFMHTQLPTACDFLAEPQGDHWLNHAGAVGISELFSPSK
jgi:hypothetical protein